MANTTTLADLRTLALQKADLENSAFVSTAEQTAYVNEANSELYDILVTTFQDYFKSSENVSLVAGTEAYALPSAFYKLLAAYYVSGGIRYRLEQFMLDELVDEQPDRVLHVGTGEHLRYRIVGNEIVFTPKPSAAGTVELWYVPQFTKLVNAGDVVSYAIVNGWEEYISNGAAIRMLQKEESDASHLIARQLQLAQRIKASARVRNAASPQRVVDVYEHRRRRFRRRC